MGRFAVAQICEQGVDLIIIPLAPKFGHQSKTAQRAVIGALQDCAVKAGLAGTVVPCWRDDRGNWCCIAQSSCHSYLKSLDISLAVLNLNRELTCEGD